MSSLCIPHSRLTMFGFHILRVLRDFLIVPVPEHGASTSILSNSRFSSLNLWPLVCVITVFIAPHLCRFIPRAFILSPRKSLQISAPEFWRYCAIWVDFEPGAAQRSRTDCPGPTSRTIGGIIDGASWMEM